MAFLEELRLGVHVKGLLPGKLVTLIEVKPYGATVVEVTYKDASGLPGTMLLYQQDAARLEIASQELPWSFDADGTLFRLVSSAAKNLSLHYTRSAFRMILIFVILSAAKNLLSPYSPKEPSSYDLS